LLLLLLLLLQLLQMLLLLQLCQIMVVGSKLRWPCWRWSYCSNPSRCWCWQLCCRHSRCRSQSLLVAIGKQQLLHRSSR